MADRVRVDTAGKEFRDLLDSLWPAEWYYAPYAAWLTMHAQLNPDDDRSGLELIDDYCLDMDRAAIVDQV